MTKDEFKQLETLIGKLSDISDMEIGKEAHRLWPVSWTNVLYDSQNSIKRDIFKQGARFYRDWLRSRKG